MNVTWQKWIGLILLSHVFITLAMAQSVSTDSHLNILSPATDNLRLSEGMYYLESTNQLNALLVTEQPDTSWHFNPGSSLYIEQAETNLWIKIPLQREESATQDWILKLDWPLLSSVEWMVFHPSSKTVIDQGRFSRWNIPDNAPARFPFAMRLTLTESDPYDVYLKVRATEKLLLPVTLWPESGFNQHRLNKNLFLGFFYGVLLALFAYNCSLFIFVKHKSYAYYSLYVLTMGLYTLVLNGASVAWFLSDLVWLHAYAYRSIVPLAFLTAVLFIRSFLELNQKSAWINYSSLLALYLWSFVLLTGPFLPVYWVVRIIDLMGFLSCFYGLGISSYLWYRGDVSAKYLTIAWSLLIVSTFIQMMALTGFIDYQIEIHYLQNIATIIEVVLLSMALAERMNRERKMRFEAQDVALRMSNEAARAKENEVAAQTKLLTIERRVKEELSLKVNEQTRELKNAMHKLQIMNQELDRLSRTDALTGLANRRHFDERLQEEVLRAKRNNTYIGLIMLDIDHFKLINDTHGHQAGDRVIQTLSALIQRVSGRASDLPARIGGEEFCLLVVEQDEATVADLAEAIRHEAESTTVMYQHTPVKFALSLGVLALKPSRNDTADCLLKQVDDALYQAKHTGRNRVVLANT